MKPYYEHGGITIYHGDCREILPLLTDKNVDLVLTDPPYNAKKSFGVGTDDDRPWEEYVTWLTGIIKDSERISSGMVAVFVSLNGMAELFKMYQPRHVCVWNKPMSWASRHGGTAFLPHWEPCLIYGKTWGESGRVPGSWMPDVWTFSPAKQNGHPCPKPLPLMKFILSRIKCTNVCDPFMGSGTTLVAAKQLGVKAIGIEIERAYCDIAIHRLEQEVLPFSEENQPQSQEVMQFEGEHYEP